MLEDLDIRIVSNSYLRTRQSEYTAWRTSVSYQKLIRYGCVLLVSVQLPLLYHCMMLYYYSTQEEKVKTQKTAEGLHEDAKRCDYPPCNASAAHKNLKHLYKCPRCNEGRYCCHKHGILDWDRHKLLCRDIKLKVETKVQF
jgi:hypothetical protein